MKRPFPWVGLIASEGLSTVWLDPWEVVGIEPGLTGRCFVHFRSGARLIANHDPDHALSLVENKRNEIRAWEASAHVPRVTHRRKKRR